MKRDWPVRKKTLKNIGMADTRNNRYPQGCDRVPKEEPSVTEIWMLLERACLWCPERQRSHHGAYKKRTRNCQAVMGKNLARNTPLWNHPRGGKPLTAGGESGEATNCWVLLVTVHCRRAPGAQQAESFAPQELSTKARAQGAHQKQEAKPFLAITSLQHPLLTKSNVVPAGISKIEIKGPDSFL